MASFKIRNARPEDVSALRSLILGLAAHERRPEDVTGSEEEMKYWLFERKIASVLIAEVDGKTAGYALYYPAYGSYSARGKIHLEDLFIREEYRGKGYGTKLFASVCSEVLSGGFTAMEWSALDFNTDSISYYKNLGAKEESGRLYFDFSEDSMKGLAEKK